MKKQLFTSIAASLAVAASAQLPVSTTPQNKKVVLEEFTGIHCGYCPDGHVKANTMYAADPTRVILVNIHSGSFANAAAGEPDFKTADGTAIDAMPGMGIAGYPAGSINRVVFSGASQNTNPPGYAQSRGSWAASGTTIKSQPAYCNIALQGTVNAVTRQLSVDVEVYYTASSPSVTNYVTVMLLENGLTGPQSNYGNPFWNATNYNADGSYNHNHVLRKVITPTFGQAINTTTMGSLYTANFTYNVPTTYGAAGKTTECMLGNLELVAFVSETDANIINAAKGPLTISNIANSLDIATKDLVTDPEVCAGNFNPTFKFTNLGSTAVTSAVFSYAVNGGAATNHTWTSSTPVNPLTASGLISLPAVSFSPAASNNNITINVVSVNGAADQVATNNVASKTAPTTTRVANSLNMTMTFTQDRYGSESKWTLYDEVSNTIIETDGPWTNLAANGTAVHTKTFTVDYNTCYKLVVEDSYGDGVNSSYGAGGYVLKSGTTNLITSNGQFGKGETKLYRSRSDVGVAEANLSISAVGLQPNPANDAAKVVFNLTQNENIAVSVVNSLGQKVFEKAGSNFNAGEASVEISTENFANGIYFVNVSSNKGTITKKLTVSH